MHYPLHCEVRGTKSKHYLSKNHDGSLVSKRTAWIKLNPQRDSAPLMQVTEKPYALRNWQQDGICPQVWKQWPGSEVIQLNYELEKKKKNLLFSWNLSFFISQRVEHIPWLTRLLPALKFCYEIIFLCWLFQPSQLHLKTSLAFLNVEQNVPSLNALMYSPTPISQIYVYPSQLKKRKACFAHFYLIKSNHSIGLFYYLNKHPIQILAPSLQEYTKPTQAGLSRICELYILHFTVSDHYCRVYTGTPLTT